jgi:uncharacterized membrane protein
VLIEFAPGLKTLAFVTNEVTTLEGVKHYIVFVPHMPNPTGGFIVVVPAAQVTETTMRPEEALKMGVSLGVLTPAGFTVDKK